MSAITVSPFAVEIPLEEVRRLRQKLLDTRLPSRPIVPGARNDYGTTASEMVPSAVSEMVADFDWSTVQAHLNRHAHYTASIPDEGTSLDVHFTHIRSQREDAILIILVHGWPGSFYEFDGVVDPLVKPAAATDPAFHVVVPSLPGFCWSPGPPRPKWTLQDHARILDRLMQGLGYTAYVAQAGDWGSFVARELGSKYSACCVVHLNFSPAPEDFVPQSEAETQRCERSQDWLDNHLGYAVCMRTRPHTIGFAISDNPVGILAWVGEEKYHELIDPQWWSDAAWDHIILTKVSLYYFSGCIVTSMLPYYENVKQTSISRRVNT